jgi:hypothetical protein
MKNYFSKWSILIFILLALSFHNALSPIVIALGIIFATLNIYKNKQQIDSTVYSMIIVGSLALMIIVEYFLVPLQNTIFYVFIIMIAIGIFLTFYFSVISKERLTSKNKILAWTGSILFIIGLSGVFGISSNNLTIPLILGVLVLIFVLVSFVIRRRINKDNALENEFTEVNSTQRSIKEEWFKFKVGSLPKPVRWQGWACYIIFFISPFFVLILDPNPTTGTVIIVALIVILITIAMFKSNYRESARENLRKQTTQQANERDEVQ